MRTKPLQPATDHLHHLIELLFLEQRSRSVDALWSWLMRELRMLVCGVLCVVCGVEEANQWRRK
jgi:hypothetical protein